MGKVAWNSYFTHGFRHNCVIDQSATDYQFFFSHGLRSVKIEQELVFIRPLFHHRIEITVPNNNGLKSWKQISLTYSLQVIYF